MRPLAVRERDRALVADRAVGSFFVVASMPSLALSTRALLVCLPGRAEFEGDAILYLRDNLKKKPEFGRDHPR